MAHAVALVAEKLPRHIAIIMDGNGRWAKARMLPRLMGHRKGAETVRMVVDECSRLGIGYLTLFAFSAENWSRPMSEVSALMNLLKKYIRMEVPRMMRDNVRFNVIGNRSDLPEDVRGELEDAIAITAGNTGLTLTLALSYGARQEIIHAAGLLAADVAAGKVDPTDTYFVNFNWQGGNHVKSEAKTLKDAKDSKGSNYICFTGNTASDITVEFNGDWKRVIHLFADPPEKVCFAPERLPDEETIRRGERSGLRVAPRDIRSGTSVRSRDRFRCCRQRRSGRPARPSRDGPGCAGFGGTGRSGRDDDRLVWCSGLWLGERPSPAATPAIHHRRLGRRAASGYTPVRSPASRWDRHARASRGGLSSMAEHRIVAPKVTGSTPVGHPTS